MDSNNVSFSYNIKKLKEENNKELYQKTLTAKLSKLDQSDLKFYDELVKAIKSAASETLGMVEKIRTEVTIKTEEQACIEPYLHDLGNGRQLNDFSPEELEAMPKSEKWVQYYRNLFKGEHQEDINTKINSINECITIEDICDLIKQALQSRHDGKASGPGNIPIELIKNGPPELINMIAKLFTNYINEAQVPDEWKLAYIVPQHKKGDFGQPENYRPISVPSTLNRLYGRVLLELLRKNFKEVEEQAAYRKDRKCIDHLFTLKKICAKQVESKRELHLVFIDIAKAFDSILWPNLFKALVWAGINPIVINAIKSIYKGSRSYVYVHQTGKFSECFPISKGIRQGCCLSPTLYNLYIEYVLKDWKKKWKAKGIPISEGNSIYTLQFADDQVVLAESKDVIKDMLSELIQVYKEQGLSINTDKTKYMFFGSNTDQGENLCLTTGESIGCCDNYLYLGFKVANDGTLVNYQRRIKKYKQWVQELLNQLSESGSTIPNNVIADGRHWLTYGSEIWELNDDEKTELLMAEKNAINEIRMIGSGTIQYEKDTEDLIEHIDNISKKWIKKVEEMPDDRLPKMAKNYNPGQQ